MRPQNHLQTFHANRRIHKIQRGRVIQTLITLYKSDDLKFTPILIGNYLEIALDYNLGFALFITNKKEKRCGISVCKAKF